MGTHVEILRRGAAIGAMLLLGASAPVRAQDDASADALTRWVTAVREHKPGEADRAAGAVASMSYAARRVLNPAMQVFLRDLNIHPARPKSKPLAEIYALIASVQQEPGVAPFLRRAAILHTDAAIYANRLSAPPDDAPAPPPSPITGRNTLPTPPPLLTNIRLIQHLDGQVVGDTPAVWHWPFARSLLVVMLAGPGIMPEADLAFVSDWYHAVAAYLLATSHHGDLNMHLQQAARVLPDDPRILFDRGCYAETLGLAIYQTLSDDPSNRPRPQQVVIRVPSESSTETEAEQLFGRALERDPRLAEARVHLARLLDLRGRHEEAAVEIDRALAGTLDRDAMFYARLFAGRISAARERPAEALAHFAEALKLYPDAQSALLGASHAAVMASDVAAAAAFVQRLADRAEDDPADPWWIYRFGPGRDVSALIHGVWSRTVPR